VTACDGSAASRRLVWSSQSHSWRSCSSSLSIRLDHLLVSRRCPSALHPKSTVDHRNDFDRFHLASDVIDRVPTLGYLAGYARQALRDKLTDHRQYIERHGEDMPEIRDWQWSG